MLLRLLSFVTILAVAACGRAPDPAPEPRFFATTTTPTALWDHQDSGARWTKSALGALDTHASALVDMVPTDIDRYCPSYAAQGAEGRKAFWVMFLSALAKHESTWRADVSGGDGRWHGLLQISPATARGYGCRASTAEALKDGGQNLSCGLRIMAATVSRDGVISEGRRGVAADWGPFSQPEKRADIQAATRALPECQG